MKCELAGAGVTLFFWIVAFVLPQGFEKELGEAVGFLIIVIALVGVWAGMATRASCRQPRTPA